LAIFCGGFARHHRPNIRVSRPDAVDLGLACVTLTLPRFPKPGFFVVLRRLLIGPSMSTGAPGRTTDSTTLSLPRLQLSTPVPHASTRLQRDGTLSEIERGCQDVAHGIRLF
jgi:hypothetical protein